MFVAAVYGMNTTLRVCVTVLIVGGIASASELSTSFEFHDSSGQFRIGEAPNALVCSGGEADKPGDRDLVRSGEFSWIVDAGDTGAIHLLKPATFVTAAFRDELGSVNSELRFFHPDGSLITTFDGGVGWGIVGVGALIGRIELVNNATDTGRTVLDDVTVEFAAISTYCTGKRNTCGEVPSIGFFGSPNSLGERRFVVRGGRAPAQATGLVLYSGAGAAATPFQGGTLCLFPAIHRSVPVVASDNGPCNSVLRIDWNAFAAGRLGGTPEPFLRLVGQNVWLQWYARGTGGSGSYLTDALHYVLCS